MEFAKTIIYTKEALPMDILPVFCDIDDFCLLFEPRWHQQMLTAGERLRRRPVTLSLSEVMTIIVLFHSSGYRDFKTYYTQQVQRRLSSAFPKLVSYNRFSNSSAARSFRCAPISRRARASAVASLLLTRRVCGSATTGVSILTASFAAWRRAAKPRSDGASASNCTSSSTSAANSWACA